MSLLSSCASKPSPSLYFLDQDIGRTTEANYTRSIGLAEVVLPSYARKEKITNLTDRHRLAHDDNHRWAEPPETAVSVAFARALEATLGRAVLLKPYPRSLTPALQIKIVLDRFLRGVEGQADLSGHYFLMNGDGGEVLNIVRFQFSVPADSNNYQGYMSAVLRTIGLISRRISSDAKQHL